MADASVQFLLNKIDTVLTTELALPDKVNAGVSDLKRELEMMTAFLKEADYGQEQHRQILVWVRQVQDSAHDIEYLLDLIELELAAEHVRRIINRGRRWVKRHSMARFIDEIKAKLESVKKIREGYPTITNSSGASSSMLEDRFSPRTGYLSLKEAEIVAIEDDKDKMIRWARAMTGSYKVLFLVGMGGSGKTTLAKQVFELVKGDFDCHAWITVSKNSKVAILSELLDQLEPSSRERPSSVTEIGLITKLQNVLKTQRYVIVLHDLWSNDVWESIRHALPRGISSRIIITTRRGDIASSRRDNSINVHYIQPLTQEKAEELFHRKAFPETGCCPSGLLRWSKCILKKCEGLPLAITEIGQTLSAREESESQWKQMHDSLVSELGSNARLSNITKVLMLSYHDLPYELKYCFLFMNMFPADSPINTRTLIRLWIAEGFIKEQTGKELEDVGGEYLKELIERSLVQVSELDFHGRPKACRIHSIMHDIILSRLQDEGFGVVCSSKEQDCNMSEKTRRISIQSEEFKMPSSLHARTLLIFHPGRSHASFSSFKLLKTLHLQGFNNLHKFPEEIVELLLLRYLCLRNTSIKYVPHSIGDLRHLETLDLKHTKVTKLPKEIRNLEKLRHLLVYRYDMGPYVALETVKGFEFSGDITALTNLQKLSFVTAHIHEKLISIPRMMRSIDTIQMLRSLRKLRKLGIVGLSQQDGKGLCETIQCLDNLYSLNLTSMHSKEILDIQEISQPPRLQRLYLKGKLERMPGWISRIHDLVRLRLKWSRLPSDCNPIEELQHLPNLLELQLLDAYTGDLLFFDAGKFKKLKILEFEQLEQLAQVIVIDGTLPSLQKLIIRRCNNLARVPEGIEYLSSLRELILCDMPANFVKQIRKGGSMHNLVQHVEIIRSYDSQQVEELHG